LSVSTTLTDYLAELEKRAPESRVDLGLERVRKVYDLLFADACFDGTGIIAIAGTNGKGSTVCFCEAIGQAMGKSTVAYTSPHITHFNERLRIDGLPATDRAWLDAFDRVDVARGTIGLTWFEQVTLAALVIAEQAAPDLLILEVGLGGRLDAVNVVDADVAILTSIGLDHMEFLGPTRADIGQEKIAIARAGRPLIVGEQDLPDGLIDKIEHMKARPYLLGRDFYWQGQETDSNEGWTLHCTGLGKPTYSLKRPRLAGAHQLNNAACAVVAVGMLVTKPMDDQVVCQALERASLPGRFECVGHSPMVILDVAHNQQAAITLADNLKNDAAQRASAGATVAVFGALSGKDVEAMAKALGDQIDHWFVGGLEGPRGQTGDRLAERLRAIGVTAPIEAVKSIPQAMDLALEKARPQDRVVVFGSFQVLAAVRSRWPDSAQTDQE